MAQVGVGANMWCFGAVQRVGSGHEQFVIGGGNASVKLPAFKAADTFLGNLKRSLGGTYTPLTSPNTPIPTLQRHSTASKLL